MANDNKQIELDHARQIQMLASRAAWADMEASQVAYVAWLARSQVRLPLSYSKPSYRLVRLSIMTYICPLTS
jgi:hypothetical protein